MSSNFTTTTISALKEPDLERLAEFAEFWKIPYTRQLTGEKSDPVFASGRTEIATNSNHPTVFSPRGIDDARKIALYYGLEVRQRETTISLPVKPSHTVTMQTIIHEFQGSNLEPAISSDNGTQILSRISGTQIYLLPIDIVREYEQRLYTGMEDSPSIRFRLISKLPIPYSIVPPNIRDWSMRHSLGRNKQEREPAPVEFLRLVFIAALAKISEKPIPRLAFWKRGKLYAAAITHDVETSKGLSTGTEQLLSIEEGLDVRSTWNIPSDRYKLPARSLAQLAQKGDLGAHDTLHDGRLILSSFEEKINRARRAKEKLERLTGASVLGFRAPLLQHSRELIESVGKAGYEYDSSTPTLEWVSPTSSLPHGTGTVFPFQFKGICEIPVSLPQDHQLTRIRQLSTSDAVKTTLETASHVKALGGACVLLVHPDYDYAYPENELDYKHLLGSFTHDAECVVMTMKNLVSWWKLRSNSTIDLSGSEPRIVHQLGTKDSENELLIQTITGYDRKGLAIEDKI